MAYILVFLIAFLCLILMIVYKKKLNVKIQAENTVVCMASLLSFNGHMSPHFDTIHLKVSTHAYFALLFHSTLSEYENSEIKFL